MQGLELTINTESKNVDSVDKPTKPASEPPHGSQVTQEHGGPKGLEPTRYGDWERKGRCIDF